MTSHQPEASSTHAPLARNGQDARNRDLSLSGSTMRVMGVAKRYGATLALAELDVEVPAGEVHALVGENGSGKSTLVGIASGSITPDTGGIAVGDRILTRHTPRESRTAGIRTVFQDGSLVPGLTVAQNLYIGMPRQRRTGFRKLNEWAERILQTNNLPISPTEMVGRISPGDSQLLEIIRAVESAPKVLLLDEATSSLTAHEIDRALDLMTRVAAEGACVLFVTHRLSEVFRVARRVSVLRDGAFQGTYDVDAMNTDRLVELMAGRSVSTEFPPRAGTPTPDQVALVASALQIGRRDGVNVTLHRGEIVGFAGAAGNGQDDLLRALARFGRRTGSVTMGGIAVRSYRDAVGKGVILLSNDRRRESLFQLLNIRENLSIGTLPGVSHFGLLKLRTERLFAREQVDRFGIRLSSTGQLPSELSGGNQQKVALARVLAGSPRVVLVQEPTQGVDVRSRMDIYRMLREAAQQDTAIGMVSSDASEMAGLCDRILVLNRGEVVAEFSGDEATEEKIVSAFVGSEKIGDEAEAGRVEDQPGSKDARSLGLRARAAIRRLPRYADALRVALLGLVILLIGAYAGHQDSTFLTSLSLNNVLILTLPLAVVGGAQFCVLFVGGLDVSVGATMTLSVVLISFIGNGKGWLFGAIFGALILSVALGTMIGFVNAFMVERARISPIIATIATLSVLSGIALILRPTPAGLVSTDLINAVTDKVGIFPISLLVVIALFATGDVLLRRTGSGLKLRAVGLEGVFAFRLGIRTGLLRAGAYAACGAIAALAGLTLAAQIGVGDPNAANSYTLLAIAAPILGGASLAGGRGSLFGAVLGSLLLVLSESLVTVLGLNSAVSYLFVGGLVLVALLSYSSTFLRHRYS